MVPSSWWKSQMKQFVMLSWVLFFLYTIYPLAIPIAMGAVLAVLFAPWMDFFEKKKISPRLASFLLTFGMTMVLIIPVLLVLFFAAKMGLKEIESWKNIANLSSEERLLFSESSRLYRGMLWLSHQVPLDVGRISELLQDVVKSLGGRLADILGSALGHLPGILGSLLLIVVSVYFFLLQRLEILSFLKSYSPFTSAQTYRLIEMAREICRSVVLAVFASAVVQAFLEMLACAVVGMGSIAWVGFLVFVASFMPLVGSLPVTLGVAVHAFLLEEQKAAIFHWIVSFLLVGVDQAIRPLFLQGTAHLHPFLAFIAVLGGLQTMGFLGIFLGPILAAFFIAVIEIAKQEAQDPSS